MHQMKFGDFPQKYNLKKCNVASGIDLWGGMYISVYVYFPDPHDIGNRVVENEKQQNCRKMVNEEILG